MAKAATRKRKKRNTRRKSQGRFSWFKLRTLIYTLILLALLTFSISVLTYVIFFRMVVAAEIDVTPTLQNERTIIKDNIRAEPQDSLAAGGTTKPLVAIIIDDMGYQEQLGESLIRLPVNLSFSFLPHAPFTPKLEELAFQQGRTILLHQPLEPKDKNWDPGPGTLFIGDLEQQEKIFVNNLSLVPHAIGVNNHMGSLYTESEVEMTALLQLIAARKLFFIDSFTSSATRGYELAQKIGVQTARRHIFLDNVHESGAICSQLTDLTSRAVHWGEAIGIAHPHPETLIAIQTCLKDLERKAQLVGVEKLAR